jgi:hypothetical protein
MHRSLVMTAAKPRAIDHSNQGPHRDGEGVIFCMAKAVMNDRADEVQDVWRSAGWSIHQLIED